MKNYSYLQQKYIVNTYPNRGITLVSGNKMSLFDENNIEYLDMMSNYGVSIFGYNHPIINKALTNQLNKLIDLHCSFNNDVRSTAAQLLIEKCGTELTQVYFSNSGAEANEAALKFIALATGKRKVIACNHSYHGKTIGALSITHGDKYRKPFEPFAWNVEFIEFNNINALEHAIDENTAAFILEPVQGEGGILVPDPNYLKQVKQICKNKNIVLVFDEIQTGCGRTGKFLACQWEQIIPDILTLGKGLAGGMPIGATLITPKIAAKISRNIHTSTFGGNPLTAAGIITTLELLNDKQLEHVSQMGSYFMNQLKTISSPLIKEVRGKGLMIGVEILNEKRNILLKKLQLEHILAIPAGENVLRFLPPYIIEKKEIDLVVKKLQIIFNSDL
ncbi:MAG: aspartate aminotransferase family protein [bacterium]|nr:aspartate aminotransferase family protein [bacterium]